MQCRQLLEAGTGTQWINPYNHQRGHGPGHALIWAQGHWSHTSSLQNCKRINVFLSHQKYVIIFLQQSQEINTVWGTTVMIVNGYKPKPKLLIILVLMTPMLILIVNTWCLPRAGCRSKYVEYINSQPHYEVGTIFPFVDEETGAQRPESLPSPCPHRLKCWSRGWKRVLYGWQMPTATCWSGRGAV